MSAPLVRIEYRRPPDREEVFTQILVEDRPEVKVTLAQGVRFDPPIFIRGEVALETGSDVVWFTFPGAWHDIGLFHRADGSPTGLYANILTPTRFLSRLQWQTTDLFLDLWLDREGTLHLLDLSQFREARARRWISFREARRALREVERLRRAHARGAWPPAVVKEWPLERARARAGQVGSHLTGA